jgi:hypothetical protein
MNSQPDRKKNKERWSLLLRFPKEKHKTTLKGVDHSKISDETDDRIQGSFNNDRYSTSFST